SALLTFSLSLFFFPSYRHPRPLHSFPTRRSSDLAAAGAWLDSKLHALGLKPAGGVTLPYSLPAHPTGGRPYELGMLGSEYGSVRSEEHTSELQSRFDLVCRLLLEKKKKKIKNTNK